MPAATPARRYDLGGSGGASAGAAIGSVVDAGAGRLAALDAAAKVVWLIEQRTGSAVALGREGEGPGEFETPRAVMAAPDGDVAVYDAALRRITVLAAAGATPRYDTALTLHFPGYHACSLQTGVAVLGYDGHDLIHVVGWRGQLLRAMGKPFIAADPFGARVLSDGLIACAAQRNWIIAVPRMLPIVRAYSASTGRLLWARELPGYRPIRIRHIRGGLMFSSPKRRGFDHAASVALLRDSVVLVQIADADGPEPGAPAPGSLVTYVLRLQDGAPLGATDRIPIVLGSSGSLLFVQDSEDGERIWARKYDLREIR